MPKKFYIPALGIELTRRCNYNCVHCYHGEPQNITITKEIIDKMFSQVKQLDQILLFGGESLLELDMFEYLLKAIDRYDLKTETFSFFTNGSILDQRVITMLDVFVNAAENRGATIAISSDQFHNIEQSQKAYDYYKSINKNEMILVSLRYTDGIDNIYYSGNAILYVDEHFDDLVDKGYKISIRESSIRPHQVCVKGDKIECLLDLCANGNLMIDTSVDYKTGDKLALGNILDDSLENIIEKHNESCPFLCNETFNEFMLKQTGRFLKASPDNEMAYLKCLLETKRFDIVWSLRILAKQKYPMLPMREIIPAFLPPTIKEFDSFCARIINDDIGLEAQNIYKADYQAKFPEATTENIEKLSFLRYCNELLSKTPLNALLKYLNVNIQLFSLGLVEKQYRRNPNEKPEYIDVCGKIPDSISNILEEKIKNEKKETVSL